MGTMTPETDGDPNQADPIVFEDLVRQQAAAFQALFTPFAPTAQTPSLDLADIQHWAISAAKIQKMWLDFGAEQGGQISPALWQFANPAKWTAWASAWFGAMPLAQPETQQQLWSDSVDLWTTVMNGYTAALTPPADLPRRDRRFADPKWREQPAFALIHQTYLLLSERLSAMAEDLSDMPPAKAAQMRFATRVILEALSPANFPMTNPLVIERTLATRGENLVRGVEHLLNDLRKGQMTHARPDAFVLGENIAATPGKVVHETPLFQLLQYSPSTPTVNATPLVIFPP